MHGGQEELQVHFQMTRGVPGLKSFRLDRLGWFFMWIGSPESLNNFVLLVQKITFGEHCLDAVPNEAPEEHDLHPFVGAEVALEMGETLAFFMEWLVFHIMDRL